MASELKPKRMSRTQRAWNRLEDVSTPAQRRLLDRWMRCRWRWHTACKLAERGGVYCQYASGEYGIMLISLDEIRKEIESDRRELRREALRARGEYI
jgi:hypothetical protein